MPPDAPQVFTRWETFCGWLLDCTEKMPKSARFTFSQRIDNLALDVFENLVEARYSKAREPLLSRVNLDLEKLRLLLRLAFSRRYLGQRALEHAAGELDTVGRMVGGWLRQQRQGSAAPLGISEVS